MSRTTRQGLAVAEPVEPSIREIRGERVILDSDLARLYGVTTKALNQAVKRNADRFPPDFLFHLTKSEARGTPRSRSQCVTLKRGQNIKYLPFAFTEHGAIMAANVLRSSRAVEMSLYVTSPNAPSARNLARRWQSNRNSWSMRWTLPGTGRSSLLVRRRS